MVPLPTARQWPFFAAFLALAALASAQTVVQWQGGNSTWFTAANWSTGITPTNAQRATIGQANVVTASGGTAANVLALDLSATGAQLILDYSSTSLGLSLGSATSNWTVGSADVRTSSGIFGAGKTVTTLNLSSGVTLLYSTSSATSPSRTLGSMTVSNSGTIRNVLGLLSLSNANINNLSGGLIHADGGNIDFSSNTSLVNQGTIRATGSGSKVTFAGTQTTANLGTVELLSGGRAVLTGTLTNTAATLNAPSGGSFELTNGTVTGGTIGAGALTFTSSGGDLDGATLTGDLVLPTNTYVSLLGGSTFTGTNLTLGNSAWLYWNQGGTLTGKSLTFGSGTRLYVSGGNATVTLGAGTTATGEIEIVSDGSVGTAITNQGAISHTSGSGSMYAKSLSNTGTISATAGSLVLGSTSTGYNSANSGTITADGTSTVVYIDGNFANTGSLIAQNSGTLQFRGSNTTANLGTVQLSGGGRARLDGTLDNIETTLNAPTGGSYELYSGTITGGTIAAGALTFTGSGGYLDGVNYAGNLVLPSSAYVRFTGGTTFSGATATLNTGSSLYWQQSGTLAGKSLSLASGSYVYVYGGNNTMTLDSASSATGDIQIYTDGSNGTAITNQGNITHTSGSGYVYARALTNTGTIYAADGSLQIGSTSSGYDTINSGSIIADNSSTIYLDGNIDNNGTLRAEDGGQLRFRGTNTTANLGTVQISTGGRALLDGSLLNGNATLTAPTGGTWELFSGTITGGTVAANALTFTSSGGALDGVTLTGDLVTAAGSGLTIRNGTSFTGGNASLGNNTWLYWQQSGTLAGKALTFGDNAYLYVSGGNSTLTLDSATTATGEIQFYTDGNDGTAITNLGNVTHTSGSGYIYGRSVTNAGNINVTAGSLQIGYTSASYNTTNTGTISATGNSTIVYLDGPFDNNGTIAAQNSAQLRFRGSNTTANLGTVQLSTGGRALLDGTLDNSSATLTAPTGGVWELYGGTINGGTIGANALTLTSSGGLLNGVTLTGNFTSFAGSGVTVTGNSTFTGPNATLGDNTWVYWQQSGTLAGKAITFGSNAYIYVNGGNNTLTLDSTSTATGEVQIYADGSIGSAITNQGNITHTASSGYLYARNLTNTGTIIANAGSLQIGSTSTTYNTANSGTITANGNSTIIYVDGNVTNTGTLVAQNSGQLRFRGANTTGNLGAVQIATGGRVLLDGTLNNGNATLTAPTGGSFELFSGTITGGTVVAGALAYTSSGGTLDNVSVTGNFTLGSGAGIRFVNGTGFTGPDASLGANSYWYWEQSGTLVGKALNFASNSYIYIYGAGRTLTLDSASSATGEVQIYTDGSEGTAFTNAGNITHTVSTGYLYARAFSNTGNIVATDGTLYVGTNSSSYTALNTGLIKADGASAAIRLNGTFQNQGTVAAHNGGAVWFDDDNLTTNIGSVQIATGGHAYLSGVFDNSATTLTAPTGGMFELRGGTINNGTVAANALTFTSSSGTLDNVTLLGNVTLPANSYAYFKGGTNLATANASLVLNNSAGIYWQQAAALNSNALTFGSNSYLYIYGLNNGLTLGASTTVTGDVQIYSDGSSGSTLTNNGTITHTTGSGYLYAKAFTNAGTITATGGTMQIGVGWSDATIANNPGAILRVNGGNMSLQSTATNPLVNQGIIDVQSGTFYTNNRLTNAAGGVVRGAGVIQGQMLVTGGTLEPGNGGIGVLRVDYGLMDVTGATTFAVELSGSTADRLVFQYTTGNINLGTGLLTLSLQLLSAPTPNTTFDLITISSGSHSIAGRFANLANNGDTITATFAGNPFTFTVNYQPTAVSLTYNAVLIPEPSTYALMGMGVAVLAWAHRRRRKP